MTQTLNEHNLIGRLYKEPAIKQNAQQKAYARLTVVSTDEWTDRTTGEKREKSSFHHVVVFADRLVQVAKTLKINSPVYVRGKSQTRRYGEKPDQQQYITETVLDGPTALLIPATEADVIGIPIYTPRPQTTQTAEPAHTPDPASNDEPPAHSQEPESLTDPDEERFRSTIPF